MARDRREQRFGLSLARAEAASTATRAPPAGPPRRSGAVPARQNARRATACRASSRRGRSPGPERPAEISTPAARSWCGAVHSRGLGGGSRPKSRPSWRTRCSRSSPLPITLRSPVRSSQASAEPRRSTTRSQRRVATAA